MKNRIPNLPRQNTLKYAMALLAGTATMGPVWAQEASAPVAEEMVVTGSRLQRDTNATSPQPISVIGSDTLRNAPTPDISDTLNENPALMASETSSNTSSTGNVGRSGNVGGSALNLRGLGTQRTLTLVNGRRHVSGIEGTSSVDVGTIPSGLIERVEVLTGGASAVYGADAVTGVVNFVLQDDFEGVELDFRPGMAERGDAGNYTLEALFGKNFQNGRGNVTVAFQHDYHDGLRRGDRPWSENDGTFGNDVNPALRFQQGDLDPSSTPNLSQYYNYDNTGLFPWGLRIPDTETFINEYTSEFGSAPNLTDAERSLFERSATATPRALMPGRTYNITSPYGVVALGDFGSGETPLGSEPDLDGNGTPDCLQSFTGYNSSLAGADSFGAAGGCWYINEGGDLVPYEDGLVAGNFNQFGAEQSFIAPNRPYIIPQDEKYSLNINGRYELTPGLEVFAETKYVYHEVTAGGGSHHATDLLYAAPDNPFIPEALQPYADNSGVSWLGPGGIRISRDSDDWGDNETTNERHTLRFVAGLRGSIDSLGLDYEVSANYGRFEREAVERETVIADRFFAAIDVTTDPATGQPVCRSDLDSTAYPQTTPFNFPSYLGGGAQSPFFTFSPGDGQCQPANLFGGRGSISQEAIDFFTYDRTIEEEMTQSVITAFVSGDSGQFFSLPAGPVSFAFGGEWREETSAQEFDRYDQGIIQVSGVTPDGTSFAPGDWVGDVSEAASLGNSPGNRLLNSDSSYDVWDVFAEVEVPLLAGLPFVEELNFSGAVRRADYSTFGSNTTYGSGLVWVPHPDLRIRANYSQAIRVPNLYELFAPEQGQNFRPDDPCDASQISSAPNPSLRQANCVASLQSFSVPEEKIFDGNGNYVFADPLSAGFPGVIGGNPNLQPEEATTETLGFVYQPYFVPGLTMSVDYWDITIDDTISELSSQGIVDSCYDSPSLDNSFCELFERNPTSTSAQSGGFVFLRQSLLNFASAEAAGYDFTLGYDFDLGGYGIALGLNATKQEHLRFIEPAGEGEEPRIDVALGELRRPEWAANLSARVMTGPLTVTWRSNYLGEQALTGDVEVAEQNYGAAGFTDDYFYHNLSGSYDYSHSLRLYGGIGNVTDKEPYATSTSYPVSSIGRSYYVGINYIF